MKKIFESTPDHEIEAMIDTMDIDLPKSGSQDLTNQIKADKLDVIMKFWPYIRPVLSIAKIFTNERIDTLIDAVIAWGDQYTKD